MSILILFAPWTAGIARTSGTRQTTPPTLPPGHAWRISYPSPRPVCSTKAAFPERILLRLQPPVTPRWSSGKCHSARSTHRPVDFSAKSAKAAAQPLAPVYTDHLRPLRMEVGDFIFSLLESGEVVVEYLNGNRWVTDVIIMNSGSDKVCMKIYDRLIDCSFAPLID